MSWRAPEGQLLDKARAKLAKGCRWIQGAYRGNPQAD